MDVGRAFNRNHCWMSPHATQVLPTHWPKIYRSISGTGPGPECESSVTANMTKANVLARVKRDFAKYGVGPSVCESWNDPYSPRADEYLTPDGFDASLPQAPTFGPAAGCPGQGAATVRDD